MPQDPEGRRSGWKGAGKGGPRNGQRGGATRQAAPATSAVEKSAATHLKERTGRTLEEWVQVVLDTGPGSRKERTEWLKSKHGLGANFAAWIALSCDAPASENGNGASAEADDEDVRGNGDSPRTGDEVDQD
jgi:hypothetical protein